MRQVIAVVEEERKRAADAAADRQRMLDIMRPASREGES